MSSDNGLSEKERYQRYLAGREWGLLKQQVKARSGGICERCRINPSDAVHHLTYERKYNERLEDLQDTCEACHKFTHGLSDEDPVFEMTKRIGMVLYYGAAFAESLRVIPDAFLSGMDKTSNTAETLCLVHAIVTDSLNHIGISCPGQFSNRVPTDIARMFGPSEWSGIEGAARCPCCDFEYVSSGEPETIDGEDNYKAEWGGRGDLLVIPFSGECGSQWDLCFGFHKGITTAFIRVRFDCRTLPESSS